MTLKNLIEDLYSDEPIKTLYHYTSLQGAMEIVSSGKLWATETRFFNDSAEIKHTHDLIRPLIAKRIEEKGSNIKLLLQFQDWLSHRLTNGHMLFAASLTTEGNLLSQWRGYCPTAKGVSIGFQPEKIISCAKNQSFRLGRCIYDPKDQTEIAHNIISEIESLSKDLGESKNRPKSQSYHDVFEDLEIEIIQIAALLKHNAFHQEKEWRLCSQVMHSYISNDLHYREGKSMLIPYLEFNLPSSRNNETEIDHVFIGPTPNQNNSMKSLSMYLANKKSNPRRGISYCQIPYREW